MPLVFVGGQAYDPNIPSDQAAIFAAGLEYRNGEWVPRDSGEDIDYIAEPSTPYVPGIPPPVSGLSNTVFGIIQTPQPGVMQNVVLAGAWSGFDIGDIAGGLATLKAFAFGAYGSTELGTIRYSSEVLENEPTGVRPGTMERIVIPSWARRARGSPL